ncbi:hypothetical protein Tco_1085683, partial [Tanacetum coccineum]
MKADELVQSSSVSSDFTSKLLNLVNPSPVDNECFIDGNLSPSCYVTTSFPSLLDFSSVFRFNDRVTNLENDQSEIKQVAQQEAQDEKNAYIELVDTSIRALIKEEVNTQLHQILPQAVSNFADLVIEKNVIESVEVVVLTRGLETIVTKIETPPLDQTEGRKKGNQVKMLSPLEIQGQRKRSLQAPLKTPPNLKISLPA